METKQKQLKWIVQIKERTIEQFTLKLYPFSILIAVLKCIYCFNPKNQVSTYYLRWLAAPYLDIWMIFTRSHGPSRVLWNTPVVFGSHFG